MHWILEAAVSHGCLHGEQGAARRRLGNVVDSTKVAAAAWVMAVHHMAVWQDVGEGAFGSEFAVALSEVFAGRSFRERFI
jgi:hypothetical protein